MKNYLKKLFNRKKEELSLEDLIRIAGERGYLLACYDDTTRSTGKSSSLINLVEKENASMITTNYYDYSEKFKKAKVLNKQSAITYLPTFESMKGLRLENVYIDELTNIKIVKELIRMEKIKLKGGIININYL